MQAISGHSPPLTVFGDDYDTPDGTCIRDYVHVADIASAHVLALDRLNDQIGIDTFNLGTGTGSSILEVLRTVENVAGRAVPHWIGTRRPGDPAVLVSDPSKAKQDLGWVAKYSALETIVLTAWAWHQRELDHQ